MYKIFYTKSFSLQLEKFIISYSSIFEKLFNDTGIENEYIIVENYRKISLQFKEKILYNIQSQLQQDLVLGRTLREDNTFSFIFNERSFLIIIDYTEDEESKTRYIENIIFAKK